MEDEPWVMWICESIAAFTLEGVTATTSSEYEYPMKSIIASLDYHIGNEKIFYKEIEKWIAIESKEMTMAALGELFVQKLMQRTQG